MKSKILDNLLLTREPYEEDSKVLALLDIVDELDDFEYSFVMDIAENSCYTEKQSNLITELHYKYIERG